MRDSSWISSTLNPDWGALPSRPHTEPIDSDLLLFAGASNNYALKTEEGLVIVDPGHEALGERFLSAVRDWSDLPIHTVIYTHGHADHVTAMRTLLDRGERPVIVGHEHVVARFARYRETHAFNQTVNRRQTAVPDLTFPSSFVDPTVRVSDSLTLVVGGVEIRLLGARGETDDYTCVWIPDRRLLFVGDLATWKIPNSGNPAKVQRYPLDWLAALDQLSALGAETLCPGHDLVLRGGGLVRTLLTDHARYLRHLVSDVKERLNAGASPDEILHAVVPPEDLRSVPYLRDVYNHPQFIVRDLLRTWGGWWNGVDSGLLPAPRVKQSTEIASLAGGVQALVARGRTRLNEGDVMLACHLADWAVDAAPEHRGALELKRDVFRERQRMERSGMARGFFQSAIDSAERKLQAL